MTDFEEIAQTWWKEPFFHLLYVGAEDERSRAILDWCRSRPRFTKANSIAASIDNLDGIAEFIAVHQLRVGRFQGVLIVVLDLGPNATDDSLSALLSRLEHRAPWSDSTQRVLFLLTSAQLHVSFRSFINSISRQICGIGDLPRCIKALEEWTEKKPASEPTIDLRLPFSKTPSGWLKNIRHDYIVNIIQQCLFKETTDAGLWDVQYRIDLWQNALRNILVEPLEKNRTLFFDYSIGDAKELQACLFPTPFRLLVPISVARILGSDMESETDYLPYDTIENARDLMAQETAVGHACILVYSDEVLVHPAGLAPGMARFIPTIHVRENSLRLPWDRWRQELYCNLLGAFDFAEFTRTIAGTSFAKVKRAFWSSFYFRSLPEAVDEVIDCMMQTYAGIHERTNSAELESLFRCIASVRSARGLYFMSPPTTSDSIRADSIK
jgi:hypothetical protein